MVFRLKTFQVVRFALFDCYVKGVEDGVAAFNEFNVQESRPHGLTKPIPFNETIMNKTQILMNFFFVIIWWLFLINVGFGQSLSFQTYMNPVIPGDHPDATLTRIGDDFYTTGSSFNITPKIYHSSDLVHWEVISQPVSASWSLYGDAPAGGVWGGHMVYNNDSYWHFFGRSGNYVLCKSG